MKFIVLAVIILGICMFIKIQNHKKQVAEQQATELRKQQVKQKGRGNKRSNCGAGQRFAVGMAANELKHKNAELKRQNKELQKVIDKINKTK